MKYYPLSGIHLSGGLTPQTWRIMKLTFIMITAFFMQVSASTLAQQLTLKENRITFKNVFTEIRKQTGYIVLYQAEELDATKTVSVNLDHASLKEAMTKILQNQDLEFTIEDQSIVIKKKETSFIDDLKNKVKERFVQVTVSGIVKDETGQPMPGVTVRAKNSQSVIITDKNGYFAINVEDSNTIIVFSYVGYETQELKAEIIAPGSAIILKVAENNLREVMINKGYYRERQELSTGDVSVVSSKTIEQQPAANPLVALEGRVPGLVITQSTGMPNGAFSVQLRGQNSLQNGNDPFYVVDGVPYLSNFLANTNVNNVGNHGNPLSFINPSDIDDIQVLKDADATAIYGSRGANGVILITTKKGKAGAIKVDVNVQQGIGQDAEMMHLLNTQQYLQMRHAAFKNDNVKLTTANAPDLLVWDTTRYTNWQKILLGGTAHYNNTTASISGGNTNTQYLIGGTFHRETTVFPGDNADQKANVHFSVNTTTPNQKLKLQLSGNYMADNTNLLSADLTNIAYQLSPEAPSLYNADGSLNWQPIVSGGSGTWTNPFARLQQRYNGKTNNLVSNVVLSYAILHNLELKVSAGYNHLEVNEITIVPLVSLDPVVAARGGSGNSTFANSFITSVIAEPQLNYHMDLGKGKLNATVGMSYQKNSYTGQIINASGFINDEFLGNPQAASSISLGTSTNTQYKYNAVYGRLNFSWQDEYILNLTARRDGSSRFGPGKQFGNFGAAGAAWIFTKEKLVQDLLPFIDFGKLRLSYGTTGNDQIGDYQYLDLYSPAYYSYQNTKGLVPQNLFNANLSWEVTRKSEAGIDLGFLKDRINLTVNWFRNRSSNQLLGYQLSDVTGFNNIQENFPATVQNTGIEFSLNTVNIKSQNFSWSTGFNLSIPHNKLIAFPDLANSSYASNLIVGQPITVVKEFNLIGVDPATGRFVFLDKNGNRTFTPTDPDDRTIVDDFNKGYYNGGFQNTFQYKGFSLDVFLQFVHQRGNPVNYFGFPGTKGANQPVDVLNAWQTPGDVASLPRYSQNFGGLIYPSLNYYTNSNHYFVDASFIRVKNVAISYSFPGRWLEGVKIQNLRLYIQAQNLWTITGYKGPDPENQNNLSMPPLRVLTAGFQITL